MEAQKVVSEAKCLREDDFPRMVALAGDWDAQEELRASRPHKRHCIALNVSSRACFEMPGLHPDLPEHVQWWAEKQGRPCPFSPFRPPRMLERRDAKAALERGRAALDEVCGRDRELAELMHHRDMLRCCIQESARDIRPVDFALRRAVAAFIDRPPEIDDKDDSSKSPERGKRR